MNICIKRNNFIFDNTLVKETCKKIGFGNPFDATKIDNTEKLPTLMKENDYFLIHLGEGKHQFVKCINYGFHKFEIINSDEIKEWSYKKSILNEFDTSESNILSVGINQKIINDFLYDDITANPKVYNARRTKCSSDYKIKDLSISTKNIQMEIDLTLELNGHVTLFEGKNNFPDDFAVYQIYHPYLYYYELKKKNNLNIVELNCCYLLRKMKQEQTIVRIYCYTFENPYDISTIKILKKAQYNLIKRK